MQFIHEEDLTNILSWFIHHPRSGTFNVAAPGSVKYSQLMSMSGKRFYWLPASLAYRLTDLSWFFRLQNDSNSTGLEFIRPPWVTSTRKLVYECGYSFQFSSEQALRSFIKKKTVVTSKRGHPLPLLNGFSLLRKRILKRFTTSNTKVD